MLTDFLAAGYSEELFWSLTPRQVERHFAAARKRFVRERNAMMETAFLAAVAPHSKRPPKLKDLLIDDEPPRRKTWQEIKALIMAATVGGR